jgi:ribonucleoside-diphosphate reductase alpha chain
LNNTWEWKQPISKEIFEMKYQFHRKNPEEVFKDTAQVIASVENKKQRKKIEQQFYDIMESGKFIPAGRILANAWPKTTMQYFNNCYTIGIDDTIEGIYDAIKEDAEISRTGGGVGLNFSKLRPKGSKLSRGGESSGVISFMKVFNESAKIIQTGGSRRAAHMGILNIDHPEIEDFITAKQGDGNKELTQFNISVGITDKFIEAVEKDLDWDLVFNVKIYKTVKAKYLYDLITKNAFEHNEPGIFNIDNVHREANSFYMYKILQTNPCGEQSLPEYGICDLGAINFSKFVLNKFEDNAEIDFDNLKETIKIGVRFLDDVLDITKYPLDKIKERALEERRIGLGFTGYADMLAMLKIKYGSKEAKAFTEKLGEFFRDSAYQASIELAKEKGAFKVFDKKILKSGFISRLPNNIKKDIKKYGLRNIASLTIAPTGTTSLSLGQNCSSGIEPIFSLKYNRNIRIGDGEETKKESVIDNAWLEYTEKYDTNIVPEYFITTSDVDVYESIDIQAIWQKYIDSSISKTINLPKGFTLDKYKELFLYAYKKGLKGITTFNPEGSLKGILEYNEPKESSGERIEYVERHMAPSRPEELNCDIHEITVNKQKHIILIGKLHGSLYEIFVDDNTDGAIDINHHKQGTIRKINRGRYDLIVKNGKEKVVVQNIAKAFDATYGTLARMVSMSLRHGTPLQFIVDQLSKSRQFISFEKAVARVLKKYIEDGEKVMTGDVCPECGEELVFNDGCTTCMSCGWSKCI